MTTVKTIALTRWTFVGKVMSLYFNMLSRLVILSVVSVKVLSQAFLPEVTSLITTLTVSLSIEGTEISLWKIFC